jgi:hypothetical protein
MEWDARAAKDDLLSSKHVMCDNAPSSAIDPVD